jgi:hypothetical protein
LRGCPSCLDENSLEKILYAVPLLIKNDPKTLGLLADRNNQRFGRNEVEERENLYQEEFRKNKNRALDEFSESLPAGASLPERPNSLAKPPWRNTDKIDTSLANLSKDKAEKYIMTGQK